MNFDWHMLQNNEHELQLISNFCFEILHENSFRVLFCTAMILESFSYSISSFNDFIEVTNCFKNYTSKLQLVYLMIVLCFL